MTLYLRKNICGVCDQPVIFNASDNIIVCGCGEAEVYGKMPTEILKEYYNLLATNWKAYLTEDLKTGRKRVVYIPLPSSKPLRRLKL